MSNKPIVEALSKVLADSHALYLKTQNYHWNVVGPHFRSLHQMFEEQYTDLAEAIDIIAERIRALGAKAPGTWKAYEGLTSIQPGNEEASAQDMVKELAGDQSKILQTLKSTLDCAGEAGDEVTVDLMVQRMDVHDKARWMLESSL